jgi:ribosome biogenesis GTPase
MAVLCYNPNMDMEKMKIEDLGWDDFFESGLAKLGLSDFKIARVVSEYKGGYKVKSINGEYLAKITGKRMFQATSREDYPAVGDWVAISQLNHEQASIQNILPRKTIIKRRFGDKNRIGEKKETQVIATNIDVAFIVESVGRDYNLNRFERYFAIVGDESIKPVIILNKVDLISEEELDSKLAEIKNRFNDVDVIATSVSTEKGLDDLKRNIAKGKTYCFLGSSGVGKSSLINRLLDGKIIKTGEISSYSDRGKHVTTKREMYFLPQGGILIDNPGIREVGITDVNAGIDDAFDEIVSLASKCKYSDCSHISEPGCAVLKALNSGKLDESRYSNYIGLKKETKYHEMGLLEKRGKNRQFGKFLKKAKKELKDSEHKDY